MIIAVTILISFLCGSIPTGYLLTKKIYGIDIRTQGSGNIGSTNVRRIAGSKISVLTQIIDVLKGVIPVALAIYISNTVNIPILKESFFSMVAIAAILGHNYTPFLSFKGGKGVNTTLGAFILIAPVATLTAIVVYFTLRLFTSIVSIRSLTLGMTIPIVCIIMKLPTSIIIAGIIAALLIIVRHKDNIKRLINKEEK